MSIRKKYITPKIEVFKMDTEVNSVYASAAPPSTGGDWDWGGYFGKSAAPRSGSLNSSKSMSGRSLNESNSFVGPNMTGGNSTDSAPF